MTVNTALQRARRRAGMSQDELARTIRETGFRGGDPNGCTRNMVWRWEAGKVVPQPRYLLALERALGQPAETLGFADADLGVDRERALADAGLDAAMPLPDDVARYDGPLTGIWLSAYEYESTSRRQTYTSRHYVMVLHRGARLQVRSLPASASQMSMDLSANGQVVTGTWTEQTSGGGHYGGAVYHGAVQMLLDPTGRRMAGQWVGFGRDMAVNTGAWSLTLVDSEVGEAAVERWNREPD